MRSSTEHGDRSYNREGGVGDKTQPVEHHRGKLPVALHGPALLVISDLVSDHLDLLEDETQLSVERMIWNIVGSIIRFHTAR